MQNGETAEFEANFAFACPKFLSPVPPPLDGPPHQSGDALHKEPLKYVQLNLAIGIPIQQSIFTNIIIHTQISFSVLCRLQQKVFMDEVRQQMLLPTIRSYLKLYTSMPMDKLAKYMNDTTVDKLESNLLCFKHKMMNLVWTKGTSGLEGDFQAESEV